MRWNDKNPLCFNSVAPIISLKFCNLHQEGSRLHKNICGAFDYMQSTNCSGPSSIHFSFFLSLSFLIVFVDLEKIRMTGKQNSDSLIKEYRPVLTHQWIPSKHRCLCSNFKLLINTPLSFAVFIKMILGFCKSKDFTIRNLEADYQH